MSNVDSRRRRLWNVLWTAWVERMTKERILPTRPKLAMMARRTPSTRNEKVLSHLPDVRVGSCGAVIKIQIKIE